MFDNVKVTEFVKRPGLGRIGRPISIRASFFEIASLTDSNIHHYDIIIKPQVSPTLNKPVFDSRHNTFAARQLPFGDTAIYNICLSEDAGFSAPLRPLRLFKVITRKVAVINMNELHKFLDGKCKSSPTILTGIMALNVLIRQKSFLTCKTVGFRQSIRPTPGKMMINVDVSATAFYESSDLVHMVAKILERNVNDLKGGIHDRDRLNLKKALKYLKIRVTHCDDEQHYIRKFNERQTADMTKFSCLPPHIGANKIKQGLDILDYRQNEYMKQFDLIVSEEMAVVSARILPAPTILFQPSSRTAVFVPEKGTWNLRDKKVATGATLGSWSCVVFGNFETQAVQYLSEN
ncbi:2123_t:CDS:2 [Funneliformis mosseae]|uniref:2123_t:CDS:1 n=1 Tax=Funneliformis mosseae TaxID=27381 RepID=A0A9N9BRU0_FUNMO|nr:2123_t:CDS:2 [Funneliformis mosseae]